MLNKRPLIFLVLLIVYLIIVVYIFVKKDPYTIDDAIEAYFLLDKREISNEMIETIEELEITCSNRLLSLKEVDLLKNLKTLKITQCFMDDVSALEKLPYLESITIDDSTFKFTSKNDILSVSHLKIMNSNIKDLSGISHLVHLETLELVNNFNTNNILKVENMPSIKSLVFSFNEGIDLSILDQFTNLERLEITRIPLWSEYWSSRYYRTDHFTLSDDFSSINHLLNLKELTLDSIDVEDLNDFSSLANLERLSIIDNKETVDLSLIDTYQQLQSLTISETMISHYKDISTLNLLMELEISYSNITDLNFLSLNLVTLRLNHNSIDDIRPLLNLHQLESLNLKNNEIDVHDDNQKQAIETLKSTVEDLQIN